MYMSIVSPGVRAEPRPLFPRLSRLQEEPGHHTLLQGFFYLSAIGKDHLTEPVRSALEPLVRPVSRGEQHFQTKESEWPVNQPLPKLASKLQASGEAIYINDLPTLPCEVYAAYVTSTVANCKLGTIDSSQAMTMPGAVACLTANDVPGINNHAKPMKQPEEILCSGEVLYAGQPVALVVADTQSHADAMAKAVKVTYTDLKPPILTIQDAIAAQSFFPSNDQEVIKGDAEGAIAAASRVVTGEVSCDSQYHFYMETQVCRCTPLEDGMEVQSSTQALDTVQNAVSQATGLAAHRIYVSVKRVGGGFGGKLNCSCIPASACAVAAHVLNRPVCLSMSLSSNMEVIGKRAPYLGKYKVSQVCRQ
ncbi:uncharacterized protein [Branchiostoma lanceolatum]|uniref:uncharacterized protein n=1 Tax=Branchiostoma lanceolatum TaxID=7740 RepID=UPI0034515D62